VTYLASLLGGKVAVPMSLKRKGSGVVLSRQKVSGFIGVFLTEKGDSKALF